MATTLPKYETQTLKNGLQVVVIPMQNGSGVISTDIFYRVGSRNEAMGKSGIAHMLEHLNFKSTKNLKAGDFDESVKSFGGLNNASTSFDSTHYYIRSSESNMDKSLELFAELMQNLNLKDEEFQPERNVVAEERRWRTDNSPIGHLYFQLFNNAFHFHPYHWTPIGFMSDIQNWSIDDIRAFHKMYYQPKNAVIVVAGDISTNRVFQAAKKHFESIENSVPIYDNYADMFSNHKEAPLAHFKEPEQMGSRKVELAKESEVEMVAIAYHIPNYEHEDQVALSAISEILSSGKSGRLYADLVDKKELANQIYAYNMESIDPSLFIFLAVCNPGVEAKSVEKEILAQIELLKNKMVADKELKKIKIGIKAEFIYGMESSSSLASLFGGYFIKGNIEPLLNFEDNLEKITAKNIQDIAKKYFKHAKSTTIILKKEETNL